MEKLSKHKTGIQWTHVPGYIGDTWNPSTGCTVISPGCKFCYAETLHMMRHRAIQAGKHLPKQYETPFYEVKTWENRLLIPKSRRKPHAFFVDSMSDLFHKDIPFEFIEKVYCAMMEANHHLFFILTKRVDRAAEFYEWLRPRYVERRLWDKVKWPLPHVLLGVSVENQKVADERIPILLKIPVAYRFLSCEPLLENLNIYDYLWKKCERCDGNGSIPVEGGGKSCPDCLEPYQGHVPNNLIHMVITGGESGNGARLMEPNWARWIQGQCHHAKVPFFMKQMWKCKPIPEDLFICQWPDFTNAHPVTP